MVHVTWPRPLQGWFVIRGLELATINLPIEFEVSISARYEDMKRDTKFEKWGGFGQLGVIQVTENSAIWLSQYEFLLVFHSNYVAILHHFWDYSEILVENRQSEPTSPLFWAPVGVTPLEFRRDLWHRQTIVPGLSYGVICVTLGSAVSVELPFAADVVRTDGRTHDNSIYRASIASRGKNGSHDPGHASFGSLCHPGLGRIPTY